LRRLLRLGAVVVVIMLVAVALYQRFLAPDPATRERIRHESRAEILIAEGDIAGALGEVEQALAIASGDPSLLVLKGALQGELGRAAAAEETFAVAETAFGDRESLLLARARAYLLLNRPEAALADAQGVVELNPESAAGYMLLGHAYDQLEDYMEALFAYQQVVTLAEEQGDFQLAGTARINVGLLMQRLQAQPREGP
jgi:tetratricopeptide (TPR) repeat protein